MTDSPSLPLAITMGDPAGCGPKITIAAWHALRKELKRPVYVIGASELYECDVPVHLIQSPADAAKAPDGFLSVFPIENVLRILPGKPDEASAPAIIKSIELATQHSLSGETAGLVTNPINKALLYGAGFKFPGHTEYVGHLCGGAAKPVMMLVGGGLRVALATIHQPLNTVSSSLTTEGLVEIGNIVAGALKNDFGIAKPRLAFSGLNPHAGENGSLGHEEIDTINPAAVRLRGSGISISDARPGDTVFAEALSGAYDAVIAMTHDQGLIPVKTLDFWGGVNVTLGLPVVRTSPDHGTAYDAAAAGTARPDSLIAAIRLADQIATQRGANV